MDQSCDSHQRVEPFCDNAPFCCQVFPLTHHRSTLLPQMAQMKSSDLKARIPFLFFREGYKVKKICRILGVNKTLVYTSLQNYMRFGTATNPYHRHRGRPRILKHTHITFLHQFLALRRTCFLNELQQELHIRLGILVSLPTLSRTLSRIGLTRKKVWKQAIGIFISIYLAYANMSDYRA